MDGPAMIWSADNGQKILPLSDDDYVSSASLTPHGAKGATASQDGPNMTFVLVFVYGFAHSSCLCLFW